MARFRPNIVLKGKDPLKPFSEDSWERIWILSPPPSPPSTSSTHQHHNDKGDDDDGGGVKSMLQIVARCQRCLLTAVDPITAEKDPSVPLKLLNRSRMRIKKVAGIAGGNGRSGPCFGMYAIPLPLTLSNNPTKNGPYGALNTGDRIKVRWRPFELDDEPEREKSQ